MVPEKKLNRKGTKKTDWDGRPTTKKKKLI